MLRLDIPALADPDAISGGGCCFIMVDDLVRDELRGWYGVEKVDIEGIRVRVGLGGRHPSVGELVDSLRALGIEVQASAYWPMRRETATRHPR